MSTPKFTPGPWHVANGVQIRSHRDQIAKVWMMRNGEGNANARLIAAAPELYEAVALLVEWWDREEAGPEYSHPDGRKGPSGEEESSDWFYGNVNLAGETHKLARAALAKARGEA